MFDFVVWVGECVGWLLLKLLMMLEMVGVLYVVFVSVLVVVVIDVLKVVMGVYFGVDDWLVVG